MELRGDGGPTFAASAHLGTTRGTHATSNRLSLGHGLVTSRTGDVTAR